MQASSSRERCFGLTQVFLGENKEKTAKILEAAKQAGFQLIKEGRMSEETLEIVGQPLVSEEERMRRYNYAQKSARNANTLNTRS